MTPSTPASTVLQRVAILDSVTESTYPPGFRLPRHAHRSAYLCFVSRGGFTERHARSVETCDRSACVFRPPDDEHANEFPEAGAVCVNVDIRDSLLARLREAGLAETRFTVRSPFVQQLRARLYDELAAPDALSAMVVESLATEILVFESRRQNGPVARRWAEKAQRMIDAEFAEPLSLDRIARAVGVHSVHLSRQFRASYGCTVGDYIRQVRVAFARQQLAVTDAPIAQIAVMAGFADQSQLTRTFRRLTGRTPAAYRAERR
ncbi:MAG TPA: AraC family transcriptional regulator [Thermoanaerobaculia bacterium]|nr:AraC family transcriptional regulator [Thermoanaerobaculia bacterium]